jgi:CHAT domain-containing protein
MNELTYDWLRSYDEYRDAISFSIEIEKDIDKFVMKLDNGILPDELKKIFEETKHPLSQEAKVDNIDKKTWYIKDKIKIYIAWKDIKEKEDKWVLKVCFSQVYRDKKLEDFKAKMDTTLDTLYQRIFIPIKPYLKDIKRIIFVPNRALFVFPLHAMYTTENGKRRYIIQDYEISYTPSAYILKLCQERKDRRKERLFIVLSNPKGDLLYSKDEADGIKRLFEKQYEIRENDAATPTEVLQVIDKVDINFFQIIAHALFLPANPLSSALLLTDEKDKTHYKPLTLEDVFLKMYLPYTYLVVLSACETGMVEIGSTDEFIGFPAGFLHAGAPTVICSLWAVNDYSTSVLMQELYKNIKNNGMQRVKSLREAQLFFIEEKMREEIIASVRQVGRLSKEDLLVK